MNMAQTFEQGLGRKLELPVLRVASYSDQPSQEDTVVCHTVHVVDKLDQRLFNSLKVKYTLDWVRNLFGTKSYIYACDHHVSYVTVM